MVSAHCDAVLQFSSQGYLCISLNRKCCHGKRGTDNSVHLCHHAIPLDDHFLAFVHGGDIFHGGGRCAIFQSCSNIRSKAEGILRRAEANAELERRKASEDIKKELVDVSSALAEKMLQREIRREDHDALIDSFLRDVGGDGDGTE